MPPGTPTGNFIPVEGTVFDLRTPKLMEELSQGAVYNPIGSGQRRRHPCAKWPK